MPAVLTYLRIRNLALVEDLEWHLAPGFTAITGETGAGKSIIIGALQLLLGERADKSLIRTGADLCSIEAIFEGSGLDMLDRQLNETGLEPCQGELIIKRSLSATGANRQFINGSPAPLSVLKQIGDELVDLHGPHDHQSLLSPDRQLALLDGFAHAEDSRCAFGQQYRRLQALRTEQATLGASESAREQEIELLRHQVHEIESAALSVKEEEEMISRYKLASQSRRLVELAGSIAHRLSEADDSILSQLAETQRLLRELEKIDVSKRSWVATHAACVVELSEISRALNRYAEDLDLDPEQLAALEERVSLFEDLKRKYGSSIAEVISFGERAQERLRKIEGRAEELTRLEKEIAQVEIEVQRAGQILQKLRRKAAPKLCASIRAHLQDLGFRQSEFDAKITATSEPQATGFDAIELLFSPNPGEPLKPLRTIASSGEISRLMLAIKSSLATQDAVPLLVFDEIDANVGGEIANAVGAKMRNLAKAHQVLCITHLPQVAAAATTHFAVTKEVKGGRTFTRISEVTQADRKKEIARMLGGETESALRHAMALLKTADSRSAS